MTEVNILPQSTDAFRSMLVNDHRHVIYVTVETATQFLELTGVDGRAIGGEVRVDGTAARRRTATLNLAVEPGDIPRDTAHILHPQSRARYTIYYGGAPLGQPDAIPDVVSCGVFVATEAPAAHAIGKYDFSITLEDTSREISDNGWALPFTVARGGSPLTVAQSMIQDRSPGALVTIAATTTVTTAAAIFGQDPTSTDPWADIKTVLQPCGAEVFPDRSGRYVIRQVPDPSTAPVVATYQTGVDVSQMNRTLNIDGGYKLVTVRGTGVTGRPVSGSFGPGGGRVKNIRTDQAKTDDACAAMAQSLYQVYKTDGDVIAWSNLVDPGREAGDVVRAYDPELSVDTTVALGAFNIPLGAGDKQQIQTKQRSDTGL